MQLKGIAAVVTGGASGLGASTAQMLAEQGAKVSVFDLSELNTGVNELRNDVHFYKVNVADEDSVNEALAQAEKINGVGRVLVNCAGVSYSIRTVNKEHKPHPMSDYRRMIEVNLVGTFNMISQFAARLSAWQTDEEERGVIVNTASVAGYEGQIGQAAYASSKGGVIALTLPVARDLAPVRIRVVTIAPGLFLTPMIKQLPREIQASLGKQVPHPSRAGQPDEFAHMVGSIIANPMVNGEVIRLDGAIRMAPR